MKKPLEGPTIGALLCPTKDDEVVVCPGAGSPTLVAECQTMLPSKDQLRSKLHELYSQLVVGADEDVRAEVEETTLVELASRK